MSQNNESNKSTALTVLAEVADALAASAPQVRADVVDTLVTQARRKRVDILLAALPKRQELFIETKKLAKLKFNNLLNEDGTVTKVPVPMTDDELKAHQKAVKEANEKLAQFEENLAKAMDNADEQAFEKLAKACGK